jgi:hypothetical protein
MTLRGSDGPRRWAAIIRLRPSTMIVPSLEAPRLTEAEQGLGRSIEGSPRRCAVAGGNREPAVVARQVRW